MIVVAKMQPQQLSTTTYQYGGSYKQVKFTPVSDLFNKSWSDSSPGGSLELTVNPEKTGAFADFAEKLGKSGSVPENHYVFIVPASELTSSPELAAIVQGIEDKMKAAEAAKS